MTPAPESKDEQIAQLLAVITKKDDVLRAIRNSAGQIMMPTVEGHSECVHRANVGLAISPTDPAPLLARDKRAYAAGLRRGSDLSKHSTVRQLPTIWEELVKEAKAAEAEADRIERGE